MLIFNKNEICSNKFLNVLRKSGGGGKKTKKEYKSTGKRNGCSYSKKSADRGQTRKSRVFKNKISKKNTQFLEGLGLKVKQKQ